MPYDVAFCLPESQALAYAVAFGEMKGNTFDWVKMRWQQRS